MTSAMLPERTTDTMTLDSTMPPSVHVGHVHLRVRDIDTSLVFYRDALGFHVTIDARTRGLPIVFLAAGDYHHHIALNGGPSSAPESGSTPNRPLRGLAHVAFVFPDRDSLAVAVARLYMRDYAIDSAEDHGGTVSVYLRDPDGNGVELYYDRPRSMWFDSNGDFVLVREPFDPRSLLDGSTP